MVKKLRVYYKCCYYDAIPEPVITDSEAFKVAKQILKLDPSNHVARNALKETAKRMDNVVVDINELQQYGNSN